MRTERAHAIIAAIGDAAERWRNADLPARVRATRDLENRLGYSEPVIDFALDALFATIDARTLEAIIVNELGSVAALDGFVARPGLPDVTYRPRDPIAIVASETTIGVALAPAIFAACSKGRVRVKDRSDGFVRAFFETVREELPSIGERVAIDAWSSAEDERGRAFLADTRAVVAFGRDDTLQAIRARLGPSTSFVGLGHRTSVAYVARESLGDAERANACARALARDVLLYDGDGCLSLHTIFCETGGALEPADFARCLARACDDAAIEFPASGEGTRPSFAAYRDAARFRAAQHAGAVHAGAVAPHLIVLDPPPDEAPPFLRRTAAVYSIAEPSAAATFLALHELPLEGFALSQTRPDLEELALRSGASRICSAGELQRPPLGGEHGGGGRILPFVRAIYRA